MRVSVDWLREWVDVGDDVRALAHALTMAGVEIEGIERAGPVLEGIVVGEVLSTEPHRDAEKLTVCRVASRQGEIVDVVCGAPNVRAGLKAPLATVGARLPDGREIDRVQLRGIESHGMLCSARELGLADESSGLLELPGDLVTGGDLVAALNLDDTILTANLTPNRGDCMSVLGIAREVAAVRRLALPTHASHTVEAKSSDTFPVRLEAGRDCPTFVARVIRGVDGSARSPFWMRERLRRAGLRPVNAVVDITNYVMLETGQPMHAYDLATLTGAIVVRRARAGETLMLLDGRTVELDPDVLVIADEARILGLAGIMGGEDTGISADTHDVLLEVAFFDPDVIAGRARRYGLVTDASQRFERGVDPHLHLLAAQRATQLLLEYAGGEAGPAVVNRSDAQWPLPAPIRVRPDRVNRILGVELARTEVVERLESIGCAVSEASDELHVTPPSWRFDLSIEEDCIEEVGRLYGFERIAEIPERSAQIVRPATEREIELDRAALLLVDRGYQEAITYSFTDPELQRILHPDEEGLALANPISGDLSVMRLSLWPGLLSALKTNQHRQIARVRLFESGRKFRPDGAEIAVIAGVVAGSAVPEQWGQASRPIDFFDVKADLEALFDLTGETDGFRFVAEEKAPLHPGQSARIYRGDVPVGWLGALHPAIVDQLDLTYGCFLFEVDAEPALAARIPEYREISRYPAIRRDLAVIVEEQMVLGNIEAVVRASAGKLLRDLVVFDLYRGPGIENGKKSIALGLNLQDTSRTLTDDDAEAIVAKVIEHLRQELGATIRDR